MKFHDIDAQGNIIVQRVTSVQKGTITPTAGRVLYDTDLSKLYYGDGSNWNEFGGTGSIVVIPSELSYTQITATSDISGLLTQTQTGIGVITATYNLPNFTAGPNYQYNRVRFVYIKCRVEQQGLFAEYSRITCNYPDGTIKKLLESFNTERTVEEGTGLTQIICLPIKDTQLNFTLNIECTSSLGSATYEILACSQISDSDAIGFYPGTIFAYGGDIAPSADWLLCDGSSVSKVTYADLFAVIGTTYGGSGANFNLPDLRGRYVLGANTSVNVPADLTRVPNSLGSYPVGLGNSGGEIQHTVTMGEMPLHYHVVDRVGNWEYSGDIADNPGSHFQLGYAGGLFGVTQPHNNIPPYMVVNYLIKT
jgi:microcystin-dependent protein